MDLVFPAVTSRALGVRAQINSVGRSSLRRQQRSNRQFHEPAITTTTTTGDEIHLRQPTPPPHSLRTPTFIGLCQREVRADRQNSGPSPVRNSVEKFRVLRGPSHEHQIMFRVARFTVRSTCRFPRDSSVRKHFNMGHRNYSLFFLSATTKE